MKLSSTNFFSDPYLLVAIALTTVLQISLAVYPLYFIANRIKIQLLR